MTHVKPAHFLIGWVALASAGGLLIAFGPGREAARIGREIRSLRTELAKPADDPKALERLAADLQSLRRLGEGRMTPIPPESDIAGLMKALGDTLNDLGLGERDITTRPVKSHGDAQSLPVTVVLNGPFTSIYEAVSRIEAMPRLVRVERLRIGPAGEKRGAVSPDGAVRAEFSVDVFFAPEAGPATAAAEKEEP